MVPQCEKYISGTNWVSKKNKSAQSCKDCMYKSNTMKINNTKYANVENVHDH